MSNNPGTPSSKSRRKRPSQGICLGGVHGAGSFTAGSVGGSIRVTGRHPSPAVTLAACGAVSDGGGGWARPANDNRKEQLFVRNNQPGTLTIGNARIFNGESPPTCSKAPSPSTASTSGPGHRGIRRGPYRCGNGARRGWPHRDSRTHRCPLPRLGAQPDRDA